MDTETRFDDAIERLKVLSGMSPERTNEFHTSDPAEEISHEDAQQLIDDIRHISNVISKRLIQPNIDSKIANLKSLEELKKAFKLIVASDKELKNIFNPNLRSSGHSKSEYLDHTSFS